MTIHNIYRGVSNTVLFSAIIMVSPSKVMGDTPAAAPPHAVPAKVDVDAQLKLLETNKENSAYNYEQYKKNMEVSSQNIVEMNKSIMDLRKKKQSTQKEAQAHALGLRQLQQKEVELINLQKLEEDKNDKDLKLIAQIQADMQKRNQIIQNYAEQMKSLQSEKTIWTAQKAEFDKLLSDQAMAEKNNLNERQKWVDKKLANRKEAAKWFKEQQVAERTQMKFKQLGE